MNRRTFLKSCLGGVAALVAAPLVVHAASKPREWKRVNRLSEITGPSDEQVVREVREAVEEAEFFVPDQMTWMVHWSGNGIDMIPVPAMRIRNPY